MLCDSDEHHPNTTNNNDASEGKAAATSDVGDAEGRKIEIPSSTPEVRVSRCPSIPMAPLVQLLRESTALSVSSELSKAANAAVLEEVYHNSYLVNVLARSFFCAFGEEYGERLSVLQFKTFVRDCGLLERGVSFASVGVMFTNLTKPATAMVFDAFVIAVFFISATLKQLDVEDHAGLVDFTQTVLEPYLAYSLPRWADPQTDFCTVGDAVDKLVYYYDTALQSTFRTLILTLPAHPPQSPGIVVGPPASNQPAKQARSAASKSPAVSKVGIVRKSAVIGAVMQVSGALGPTRPRTRKRQDASVRPSLALQSAPTPSATEGEAIRRTYRSERDADYFSSGSKYTEALRVSEFLRYVQMLQLPQVTHGDTMRAARAAAMRYPLHPLKHGMDVEGLPLLFPEFVDALVRIACVAYPSEEDRYRSPLASPVTASCSSFSLQSRRRRTAAGVAPRPGERPPTTCAAESFWSLMRSHFCRAFEETTAASLNEFVDPHFFPSGISSVRDVTENSRTLPLPRITASLVVPPPRPQTVSTTAKWYVGVNGAILSRPTLCTTEEEDQRPTRSLAACASFPQEGGDLHIQGRDISTKRGLFVSFNHTTVVRCFRVGEKDAVCVAPPLEQLVPHAHAHCADMGGVRVRAVAWCTTDAAGRVRMRASLFYVVPLQFSNDALAWTQPPTQPSSPGPEKPHSLRKADPNEIAYERRLAVTALPDSCVGKYDFLFHCYVTFVDEANPGLMEEAKWRHFCSLYFKVVSSREALLQHLCVGDVSVDPHPTDPRPHIVQSLVNAVFEQYSALSAAAPSTELKQRKVLVRDSFVGATLALLQHSTWGVRDRASPAVDTLFSVSQYVPATDTAWFDLVTNPLPWFDMLQRLLDVAASRKSMSLSACTKSCRKEDAPFVLIDPNRYEMDGESARQNITLQMRQDIYQIPSRKLMKFDVYRGPVVVGTISDVPQGERGIIQLYNMTAAPPAILRTQGPMEYTLHDPYFYAALERFLKTPTTFEGTVARLLSASFHLAPPSTYTKGDDFLSRTRVNARLRTAITDVLLKRAWKILRRENDTCVGFMVSQANGTICTMDWLPPEGAVVSPVAAICLYTIGHLSFEFASIYCLFSSCATLAELRNGLNQLGYALGIVHPC